MAKIIYITGGARSGKSSFAEKTAAQHETVTYIATAVCSDEEMEMRIARHRQERPKHWRTIEEHIAPYQYINSQTKSQVVLLDCMSVWVSNLMLKNWDDEKGFLCSKQGILDKVLSEIEKLILAVADFQGTLIIVSNEVGSGIVPMSPLARLYRDCLGFCNQRIADIANQVYWCVSGIPMLIKESSNEE